MRPGVRAKGTSARRRWCIAPLANLSKLPPALIELVERYCEAERRGETLQVTGEEAQPVVGRAYGPLAGLLALAREMGVERALGTSRQGKLALLLVLPSPSRWPTLTGISSCSRGTLGGCRWSSPAPLAGA